jgi:RHS repeat-associated protein
VAYTFDPQGSVAQRLDVNENVVSSDLYDAYSNRISGSTTDPVGYGGQWGYYTDSETGLVLCTCRYYDLSNGRWLTRDPIGYRGGINRYGYTTDNPVNATDRLGLVSIGPKPGPLGVACLGCIGGIGIPAIWYFSDCGAHRLSDPKWQDCITLHWNLFWEECQKNVLCKGIFWGCSIVCGAKAKQCFKF